MNINIKKIKLTDFFLFYNIILLMIEKTRFINPAQYTVLAIINSFIIMLILLIRFRNKPMDLQGINIPVCIFLFYCTLSIFWSEYTFDSLIAVLRLVYATLVIFLSFNTVKNSLSLVNNSLNIMVIINILYVLFFPTQAIYETGEWQGIYLAKNTFASFILLTFMFNTFYYLEKKGRGIVYFFWSLVLFMLILKAQSVAVLVLFILFVCINIFLYMFNKIKNVNLKISCAFLSVSIITTLYYLTSKYIPVLFGYFGKDVHELTGRDIIWSTVINYAFEDPVIGKGYGGVWIYNGYLNTLLYQFMDGFDVYAAHNTYIDIFVNIGFVGLGIFTLILLIFLKNTLKILLERKEFIYFTILVITFIQSCTETRLVLYIPIYWYVFLYFYVELSIKISKVNKNKEKGSIICDQKNHLKI